MTSLPELSQSQAHLPPMNLMVSRLDGKRPDGLTLVPWAQGKPLTWDVTVICTSASSYLAAVARAAGSVAELAAARKEDKYSCLANTHVFEPIAFETLGPMNSTVAILLCHLGRRATGSQPVFMKYVRPVSFFNVFRSIFNVLIPS